MKPSTELLLRDLHARLTILPQDAQREAIDCLRRLLKVSLEEVPPRGGFTPRTEPTAVRQSHLPSRPQDVTWK